MDFIGLNYYFHKKVKLHFLSKEMPFLETIPDENVHQKQDVLDWEIYPKGIYNLTTCLYKRYKKEIYITENGISDTTDSKRSEFIIQHLNFIKKAIDEGIPIKGYFYWTLVDNFEWVWGYKPKFGLAYIDKGKRILKNSAKTYALIAKNKHI
jgi:beta-glucosidase